MTNDDDDHNNKRRNIGSLISAAQTIQKFNKFGENLENNLNSKVDQAGKYAEDSANDFADSGTGIVTVQSTVCILTVFLSIAIIVASFT